MESSIKHKNSETLKHYVNNASANPRISRSNNKIESKDRVVHDWYRFVLSFPPHLVREYFEKFELKSNQMVIDPFCGTGTTNVEAKKLGIQSVGIEAHPMSYFASKVKVDWNIDPQKLKTHSHKIAGAALKKLRLQGIDDKNQLTDAEMSGLKLNTLLPESAKLLLKDSISPLPLHKALILLEEIRKYFQVDFYSYETLALAKALVSSISNLHFGPEVGVRAKKVDVEVVDTWLLGIESMVRDLEKVGCLRETMSNVYCADSRHLNQVLKPNSIDAVFTSPPYPNEKDYTRTTRLETVILGFITNKSDLQSLKRKMIRSNTRGVYKGDDDDLWVSDNSEIQIISENIEKRRIQLGKTSGFERLYHRVAKLYFGGMKRHLADLRQFLKPGAYLGYVVGDQASYLRILIRTGNLLADIAKSLGYEVIAIDLFRTRFASATKEQMREEVVVLRWPG